MAFTQITVTGRYQTPDGSPAAGLVVFTPSAPMRNSDALSETSVQSPVTGVVVDGALSVSVAATTDPGTTPVGATYRVRELLTGARPRTYHLAVRHDGGPIDLATTPVVETYPAPVAAPCEPVGSVAAHAVAAHPHPAYLLASAAPAGGQVRVSATAGVALSGHRAVTRGPDGTLGYASNSVAAHLHAPIWLTLGATTAGAVAEVLAYGAVDESSWSWTPGPLHLAAGGLLTQVPPVSPALFVAQLGFATAPTSAFFDRHPSIALT